jgi:molecular chaperone GrpE
MSAPRDDLQDEGARPAGPAAAGDPPPPATAQEVVPPTTSPTGDADQVEQDFEALLKDAHRERDEYLELARRTKADFENYRKRMATEVQASAARGKAALVGELVHVLDNLERALKAAESDDAGPPQAAKEALAHGVRLTHDDVLGAFKNHGVEAFDPVGESFDPMWHQALTTKPSEDHEAGIVIATERKGYRIGDQLIRPALVIVSE